MVNSERERKHGLGGAIVRRLVAFLPNRRGNVAVLTGLLIVPFVASLSLGGELGMWFMTNRSMQNAADSAAIAAATTRSTTGTVYQPEANAVAGKYGYTNGANNVTVSATYGVTTGQGCSAAEPCYEVQISKTIPLYFASIVGFPGNATLNGQKAETITATAISTSTGSVGGASVLCILALGSVADAILLHGHPDSVLTGCDIASNDETRCTGSPIDGVIVSFALGSQNTCGASNQTLTSALPDPEAGLAGNIPTATAWETPPAPPRLAPAVARLAARRALILKKVPQGSSPPPTRSPLAGQTKIWCGDFQYPEIWPSPPIRR